MLDWGYDTKPANAALDTHARHKGFGSQPNGVILTRNVSPMAKYLDMKKWNRRDVFEFFRAFDKPYFNVCTQLDITQLLTALTGRGVSVSLAYHYFALRAANEIEPFRYRLKDGQVIVYDVIHGGTTVLLPSEIFTLTYFEYEPSFKKFMAGAELAMKEAVSGDGAFRPNPRDDMIHFTTLPWVSFTSFSHARNWGREDSVPKIAFGKFMKENGRTLLPFSVEVHHALMDGLHVGRYVACLEEALRNPETFLSEE